MSDELPASLTLSDLDQFTGSDVFYLCLFEALALVEFLARRSLFPTWVFGVQAQPFGAHCWVQQGDFLLNEGSEYAKQFTPIMAI